MRHVALARVVGLTAAFTVALLVAGTADSRVAVPHDPPAQSVEVPAAAVAPARSAEAPVAETAAECDDASLSSETPSIGNDAIGFTEGSATAAAACKPCKDRTWCKCTYNGMTRSSCNPCCYRNNIGVLTCLD